MKNLEQHFKDDDNFAILTVSLDDPETTPDLCNIIREFELTYPVLHAGADDGWNDGSFDWDIMAVPSSFIINPQGLILKPYSVSDQSPVEFEALMAQLQPVPPYAVDVTRSVSQDGSFQVAIKAYSPDHRPVTVQFYAGKIVKEYVEEVDGELLHIDPIPEGKEWNCSSFYEMDDYWELTLDFAFDEFGEATQYIDIPAVTDPNLWYVSFSAVLVLPGTQNLDDGYGIRISNSSEFWAD